MRGVGIAFCLALCLADAQPLWGQDLLTRPLPLPDQFKVVRTIDTGGRPTSTLAFSPDGRILAAAKGKRVHFWDTATGKEIRDAWRAEEFLDEGTEQEITHLIFIDAKTVAIRADHGSVVHIRSYPSGKALGRINVGQNTISHVITAPGLIAWTVMGDVRVFAAPDWKQQMEISILRSVVRGPSFSPDGSELAVIGSNQICVYRTADGKLVRQLATSNRFTHWLSIAYSPNGRQLAVASLEMASEMQPHVLELWDAGLTAPQTTMAWDRAKNAELIRPMYCSYTSDGKTLIVQCTDGRVRLFETQTGGLRHTVTLQSLNSVAPSPDGRFLAVRNNNWGQWEVKLIDWRAAIRKAEDLDAVWADLASADSAKGYRAVVALAADPVRAAKVIGERLKPVPNADAVKTLIADLGAEEYRVREAATKELAKLRDTVESELRAAAKDEQPERRDRATRLLKVIDGRGNPERLRALRAVEVLEYADTPMGRAVLKTLAGGTPGTWLTLDAKAALARLEALDPKR